MDLSLVVARRRYSPDVVHGVLTAVASLAGEHWALGHHGLWQGHGLGRCRCQTPESMHSICDAWAYLPRSKWNLPGPGIEYMPPALAGRFITIGPAGKS